MLATFNDEAESVQAKSGICKDLFSITCNIVNEFVTAAKRAAPAVDEGCYTLSINPAVAAA